MSQHPHFIKACENGHLIAQCRCIGPKTTITVPAYDCPRCKKEAQMDSKTLKVGDRITFENLGYTSYGKIKEVRESDGHVKVTWDDGFEDFVGLEWYHPDEFDLLLTESND